MNNKKGIKNELKKKYISQITLRPFEVCGRTFGFIGKCSTMHKVEEHVCLQNLI